MHLRDAELSVCAVDDATWLDFVSGQPAATAFHQPAWSQVLTATYGYPCFALVERDSGGQVVAGLPLAWVDMPFGRGRLVSLPFTDHCPLLAVDGVDGVARFASSLARWRKDLGRPVVEVRDQLPSDGVQHVGTRHVLGLLPDVETVFKRLDKGRIRNRIVRARESGLEAVAGYNRALMADFLHLHRLTRKRLGVPVQPRRFFDHIFELVVARGTGFLVVARRRGRPVAAALFLCWNGNLIYKFSASDRDRWVPGANHLVLWTGIETGCAAGCQNADLGRTDAGHESLRVFKAGWGARELPLFYTRFGASGQRKSESVASKTLARIIRWSPLIVGQAVGELFYRYAA